MSSGAIVPAAAVAAGAGASAIAVGKPAQSELVDAVRHWVHFDNLAESLTKQVTNARTMRSTFEEKILNTLEKTGMQNAVLQITGATLQRTTRAKQTDLSWSYLESTLHEYFKGKGKPDETAAIVDYLHARRGSKTVEFLKKTPS
jgi:hypothetical protein